MKRVLNIFTYKKTFLNVIVTKQIRSISSNIVNYNLLDPWWVTGYTDGEGCFTIKTIAAKTTKIGYTVRLTYQISVHPSDIEILYKLKAYFNNVGNIIITKNYVSYRVTNLSDIINVIIPHFEAYPLQSTKIVSYCLFYAVATIMKNNNHVTLKGYREILSHKAALKKGLNAVIFKVKEFSDIIPFDTSNIIIKNNLKLDPNYIAGFVAADGSFFISRPSPNSKWPNYDATLSIAQNKRDVELLNRMIEVLGCGNIKSDSSDMRYLVVRNKKELYNNILPFFSNYNINSEKHKDFMNFEIAVSILYNNLGKGFNNLSVDNIKILEYCINSMNKNRYNN
jgi:hypothetical protein